MRVVDPVIELVVPVIELVEISAMVCPFGLDALDHRAVLLRCVHESREESRVFGGVLLGMPLHGHPEWMVRELDRLNSAVIAARRAKGRKRLSQV